MTKPLFKQFVALLREHPNDFADPFDVDYYIYDEHLGEFAVPVRITVTDPEQFTTWLAAQLDNDQITSPIENYMTDELSIHLFDDQHELDIRLSLSDRHETLAQIMALAEEYEAPAITCVVMI